MKPLSGFKTRANLIVPDRTGDEPIPKARPIDANNLLTIEWDQDLVAPANLTEIEKTTYVILDEKSKRRQLKRKEWFSNDD